MISALWLLIVLRTALFARAPAWGVLHLEIMEPAQTPQPELIKPAAGLELLALAPMGNVIHLMIARPISPFAWVAALGNSSECTDASSGADLSCSWTGSACTVSGGSPEFPMGGGMMRWLLPILLVALAFIASKKRLI